MLTCSNTGRVLVKNRRYIFFVGDFIKEYILSNLALLLGVDLVAELLAVDLVAELLAVDLVAELLAVDLGSFVSCTGLSKNVYCLLDDLSFLSVLTNESRGSQLSCSLMRHLLRLSHLVLMCLIT